jgi:hypothetical protein
MGEQRLIGRRVRVYLNYPTGFGDGRIVAFCDGTLATRDEYSVVLMRSDNSFISIPTENTSLMGLLSQQESQG